MKRRNASFSLLFVFISIAGFSFSQDEQFTKELGVLKEITFSKTPDVLDIKLIQTFSDTVVDNIINGFGLCVKFSYRR